MRLALLPFVTMHLYYWTTPTRCLSVYIARDVLATRLLVPVAAALAPPVAAEGIEPHDTAVHAADEAISNQDDAALSHDFLRRRRAARRPRAPARIRGDWLVRLGGERRGARGGDAHLDANSALVMSLPTLNRGHGCAIDSLQKTRKSRLSEFHESETLGSLSQRNLCGPLLAPVSRGRFDRSMPRIRGDNSGWGRCIATRPSGTRLSWLSHARRAQRPRRRPIGHVRTHTGGSHRHPTPR